VRPDRRHLSLKGRERCDHEVAAVMSGVEGIGDSSVYGVAVPGCDGRVGMAAISLTDGVSVSNFNWESFRNECTKKLPV
jgi:fatty-acyl-CoA synthase